MKNISAHILTLNNEQTIAKTIESISFPNVEITIGDLGSSDKSLDICKSYNLNVINLDFKRRDDARNYLVSQSICEWQFYIEPWETVKSGWENIEINSGVFITAGNTIGKSYRSWNKKDTKFINPVCEHLDVKEYKVVDCVLESNGGRTDDTLTDEWIAENPMKAPPYYYKAMSSLGNKSFLSISDKYLFYEKQKKPAVIMIKYHRAMAFLKIKEYKKAVEEIKYCLAEKPEMAEFWCVAGDILFAMQDFPQAKQMYSKSILCERNIHDNFFIIPAKYNSYPVAKIASCEEMVKNTKIYSFN